MTYQKPAPGSCACPCECDIGNPCPTCRKLHDTDWKPEASSLVLLVQGRVIQENVDPSAVSCPFCGAVVDLNDEDGIAREHQEDECQECGAWVEITKFNVTVEWRKA